MSPRQQAGQKAIRQLDHRLVVQPHQLSHAIYVRFVERAHPAETGVVDQQFHLNVFGLHRLEQLLREHWAERIGGPDVRHQPAAEETPLAAFGVIEDLIRDDDVPRRVILTQAAARRDGYNPFDAQQLEREDVGAVIHLRR